MKDTNLKAGNIWGYVTALVIAAMLCGTAIFVSIQYRDAANIQAQSTKDSADTIKNGLGELGQGICHAHNSSVGYSGCKY